MFFLRETSLGREKRSRELKVILSEWLGNSQHFWMWDYKSITQELEKIGFIGIRRAEFGGAAADIMYREVEGKERWRNCLGAECKKV